MQVILLTFVGVLWCCVGDGGGHGSFGVFCDLGGGA